jgi:hypothetical protein
MRWSKADGAAVEPAPMAMTICLNGTVVASPAANTPAAEQRPRSKLPQRECELPVPRALETCGSNG